MTEITIPYPQNEDEWKAYFDSEHQTLVIMEEHFNQYGNLNPGLWGWIHSALDDDLAHRIVLLKTKEEMKSVIDIAHTLQAENTALRAEIEDLKALSTPEPTRYPEEKLDEDEDDGTMPENVETLASHVVGHKIVSVDRDVTLPEADYYYYSSSKGFRLTLDNGKKVYLVDGGDCCAYTELEEVITHLDKLDHVITGVGTTDGYTTWHIYADLGDIVELKVGWSCGNPFYYGYGFTIIVEDEKEEN